MGLLRRISILYHAKLKYLLASEELDGLPHWI